VPDQQPGDLTKAIRAIGRVRQNTPEARAKVHRYIMRRAMGLSNRIPDTCAPDGMLKGGGS
jgi:ribosomal protein S30